MNEKGKTQCKHCSLRHLANLLDTWNIWMASILFLQISWIKQGKQPPKDCKVRPVTCNPTHTRQECCHGPFIYRKYRNYSNSSMTSASTTVIYSNDISLDRSAYSHIEYSIQPHQVAPFLNSQGTSPFHFKQPVNLSFMVCYYNSCYSC